MLQKYFISLEGAANDLTIKEYAVIDRQSNKNGANMDENDYALMYEEHYEGHVIEHNISMGLNALIGVLRTSNLFPIKPYASEIAKSVIELYDCPQNRSVDLYFDDLVE